METTLNTHLKGKVILVVDDEPDILETVEEMLEMCVIHKASDYNTALQCVLSYTYDIVILNIMGVNGFELLKRSVYRGFPTVMLTAHALTPESLKKSIKLGAVFFLPKDKLPELESILIEVVQGGGKAVWKKLFDKLGGYFNKKFGPDWKEKNRFFNEFKASLKEEVTEK